MAALPSWKFYFTFCKSQAQLQHKVSSKSRVGLKPPTVIQAFNIPVPMMSRQQPLAARERPFGMDIQVLWIL